MAPMADEAGFTEFVEARSHALMRTAYLLAVDHQLAEDLVQTALFKAARAWHRIEGDPEFFVRRILYTESISWRRRWQRWRRWRLVEVATEGYDRPADPGVDVDLRVALGRALDRLTQKRRTVLVLRYFEGLTEFQTARVLGVRVTTVRSTHRQALSRLRALAADLCELMDRTVVDELRDLMTRLADEAGSAREDPTLWRRARRSRQRRWLGASAVATVLAFGVGVVVDPEMPGNASTPGGVADSATSSARRDVPMDPNEQYSNWVDPLPPGTYDVPIESPGMPRVTIDVLEEGFMFLARDAEATFVHAAAPPAYGVSFFDGEALSSRSCTGDLAVDFKKPGPEVADFAAALGDSGRRGTHPVPVSLGGYPGLYVELILPRAPSCGPLGPPLWVTDTGSSTAHLERGAVERIWILDVEGRRLVIDAWSFAGVGAYEEGALANIVESATITAPDEPRS